MLGASASRTTSKFFPPTRGTLCSDALPPSYLKCGSCCQQLLLARADYHKERNLWENSKMETLFLRVWSRLGNCGWERPRERALPSQISCTIIIIISPLGFFWKLKGRGLEKWVLEGQGPVVLWNLSWRSWGMFGRRESYLEAGRNRWSNWGSDHFWRMWDMRVSLWVKRVMEKRPLFFEVIPRDK